MDEIEVVINITRQEWEYLNKLVKNGDQLGHYERLLVNGTPLPKRHGRLIDADKVENITWQEPYYHDALNVLSEVRDKVRELPTIIEADKEERK